MRHVWDCGANGCLASEVQASLGNERPIALTTVLTTLDRLFDKGILARERDGKAYRYRAALTEAQVQQRIVEGVLGDLIAQFPQAVAAYFAQPLASDAAEAAKMDELVQRIEAVRRAREASGDA